jgi:hypothetical protein
MSNRRASGCSTAFLALASAFFLGPVTCGKSTSSSVAQGNGGNGAGGGSGGSSAAGSPGAGAAGTTGLGGLSGGAAGAAATAGSVGTAGRGGSAGVAGLGGAGGSAGVAGLGAAGGSAGVAGLGGSGGHAGSSGGGATGVAGSTGAGGRGGSGASGPGGSSGRGGAAGAAGSGGTGGGAFVCNLVIGNSTTQQWFDSGFLTYAGIDPTRWELYWVAHHYIDSWANPADSGWTTPLDMGHGCTSDSTTPDRVIFIVTYAPPYPTEATYQTDLTSVVENILSKYATVKRIELMTLIRAPGNSATACSSQANNEQSIPPAEDDAIAAVAADTAFGGLVFALPPAYVTSCSDFLADAPQYTTAGATDIAQVYGAYYAAHP